MSILAIDVYYTENNARIVGVIFENWDDQKPNNILYSNFDEVSEYESGSFFKRELPCILHLLKNVTLEKISTIIVDSYVFLDDENKLGLGGYLYQKLNNKIPIIGVAKKAFHLNKKNVIEILRGESTKPLYVSSVGVDLKLAANCIINMHGEYRTPTLLKLLDVETKKL